MNNKIEDIIKNTIFKSNSIPYRSLIEKPNEALSFSDSMFGEADFGIQNEIFEIISTLYVYFVKKYENALITAKSSIYKLFLYRYELTDIRYSIIPFEFRPSELNFSNQYVHINEEPIKTPNDEQCKHVSDFLKHFEHDNTQFLVSYKKYKNTFKYKINYIDSINFLLYFIYQDGRKIHSFEKSLPNFSPSTSCSKHSQKMVFTQILLLFHNPKSKLKNTANQEDKLFRLIELYNTDKFFCIFKMQKMTLRYIEFMEEKNLEEIYNRFDFTYREARDFEKSFIEQIFENEDFISFCLKCNYPDPFQIFNLVFNYFLHFKYYRPKNISYYIDHEPDANRHDISLKEIIISARETTIKIINFLCKQLEDKTNKTISELKQIPTKRKSRLNLDLIDIFKSSGYLLYSDDNSRDYITIILKEADGYYTDSGLIQEYIDSPNELRESDSDKLKYFDKLCTMSRKLLFCPIFKK